MNWMHGVMSLIRTFISLVWGTNGCKDTESAKEILRTGFTDEKKYLGK